MTIRTSSKFVTFNHPFKIGNLSEIQPKGCYKVVTDEKLIEGLSFIAYRRIRTTIHLHSKNKIKNLTRALTINPKELETACQNDKTVNSNILEDLRIEYQFNTKAGKD